MCFWDVQWRRKLAPKNCSSFVREAVTWRHQSVQVASCGSFTLWVTYFVISKLNSIRPSRNSGIFSTVCQRKYRVLIQHEVVLYMLENETGIVFPPHTKKHKWHNSHNTLFMRISCPTFRVAFLLDKNRILSMCGNLLFLNFVEPNLTAAMKLHSSVCQVDDSCYLESSRPKGGC